MLKKTHYNFIDVSSSKIIKDSFKKTKIKFDIIIDDSTHDFNHQINIVKELKNFLKPGGLLVIEDVPKKIDEKKYETALRNLIPGFKKVMFIETFHSNNFTSNYFMTKLLFLIK